MSYHNSHRAAATSRQRPIDTETDAFVIDDEFDDFLDRELLAIRESLADYRNL